MIQSDLDIQQMLENDRIDIDRRGKPLHIGVGSVDLHLMPTVLRQESEGTVEVDDQSTYPMYEQSENLTIQPNEFVLATTEEFLKLPAELSGFIWGRSSIGRLGLKIHNAGFTDPGYHGQITLELKNEEAHPIKLKEYMRICQITFHRYQTEPSQSYSAEGKYQHQQGATPSRLWRDFE